MASRRQLKKNVNYIIGELFSECVVNKKFIPNVDAAEADRLLVEILKVQEEFISRISHTEPGNEKKYYKHFSTEFNKEVDAIINSLSKLSK